MQSSAKGFWQRRGRCCCWLAPAAGKTTVLIHRIANLIKYGCGSDSNEVPDWVTPEDVRCLEAYLKNPEESRRQRAEMLCKLHPAAPWSILAITFTNKAAGELKEPAGTDAGPGRQ